MRFALSALALCFAHYPAHAQAGKQEMCGRLVGDPTEAVRALRNEGATLIDDKSRFYSVYTEPNRLTIWTLTKSEHPAHPALVCRAMSQREDGSWWSSMQVRCGGKKPDCDKLVADFSALNEDMRKYIEKKKRP